jgi:hypothetical protein
MTDLDLSDLERPAFFDGQRLTADDLAQAQAFARDLRWLHNRSLHGWGVVLGLVADGERGATTVTVHAGYALDCDGRDLILEEARVLEVPAAAGPATYVLTISYADDGSLDAAEREGVCGRRGAVRLVDEPMLRWQDPYGSDPEGAIRPGLDVVLATATVEACKLSAALSGAARRELPRPSPYVAGGSTPPDATPWRLWPDESAPLGVATTVATGEAGFGSTPAYQARLGGDRELSQALADRPVVLDGVVHVAEPDATSFELRVVLPSGAGDERWLVAGTAKETELNPDTLIDAQLPDLLTNELGWHVVWIGVEP